MASQKPRPPQRSLFSDEPPPESRSEWPEHWKEYPSSLYRGEPPAEAVETSVEAAKSIKAHATKLAARVLAYITAQGRNGSTSDQAEVALEMSHQTCSARFRELALVGRIYANGDKRFTRSMRRALVWRATGW